MSGGPAHVVVDTDPANPHRGDNPDCTGTLCPACGCCPDCLCPVEVSP